MPPLELPHLARLPDASDVAQYESVRLVVAGATAVNASFALTEAAVAGTSICHRLDGLPLGIEVAAARASHLPPAPDPGGSAWQEP